MNETIADIIAEKREMADALESATSRDRTAEQQETIDDLRTDADRVEAAWKREREELERYAASKMLDGATIVDNRKVGNAAAVREALELLNQVLDSCVLGTHSETTANEVVELYFRTKAALAAPPRQCDIGTAEEQAERFARYCGTEVCKRKRCKTRPKALVIDACALCWAQMPYEAEEGGAK